MFQKFKFNKLKLKKCEFKKFEFIMFKFITFNSQSWPSLYNYDPGRPDWLKQVLQV